MGQTIGGREDDQSRTLSMVVRGRAEERTSGQGEGMNQQQYVMQWTKLMADGTKKPLADSPSVSASYRWCSPQATASDCG